MNLQTQLEELRAAYKAVNKEIKTREQTPALQAPILHASAPDKCDIRISWVLQGANALYRSFDWAKYTEAALPAATVARTVGKMARAQAFENAQAELFRAKTGFGLQN